MNNVVLITLCWSGLTVISAYVTLRVCLAASTKSKTLADANGVWASKWIGAKKLAGPLGDELIACFLCPLVFLPLLVVGEWALPQRVPWQRAVCVALVIALVIYTAIRKTRVNDNTEPRSLFGMLLIITLITASFMG